MGHGSDKAVLLGLSGHEPDTVDVNQIDPILARIRSDRRIILHSLHPVCFDESTDLQFRASEVLPFHTNAMRISARGADGSLIRSRVYYSVGGGFIVDEETVARMGVHPGLDAIDDQGTAVPFRSGAELMALTESRGCSIADVMLDHERQWRDDAAIEAGLLKIWSAMQDCVARGCRSDGVLPGGLNVRRRAGALAKVLGSPIGQTDDPLAVIDWVNLYALAVNEENAAGGRVVTAPTNGAAGIVPAVLHYYANFVSGANSAGVVEFLLTAGAIGILYKENASISGAEVGCQGEVGVACSMAAGALCAVLGGTPRQVENAAEIGMEHHLGLTCDPIRGLVQIPCIERNALASVKAINAARMALRGDGTHHVSLDQVIKTMRETGADMMSKYKETALGGLAVNVIVC